jgi:hypothetical protein
MRGERQSVTMIFQHLVISLLAWLTGTLVGSVLGYGCALIVNWLYSALPSLARFMILLPWRTVLIRALLLISFIPIVFGLGPVSSFIVVGLLILQLAVPLSAAVFLQEWHPSSYRSRLLGVMRSLAVFAPILTLYAGMIDSGTMLSGIFVRGIQSADTATIHSALWAVFLMALGLDVLIGAAQMALTPRTAA